MVSSFPQYFGKSLEVNQTEILTIKFEPIKLPNSSCETAETTNSFFFEVTLLPFADDIKRQQFSLS